MLTCSLQKCVLHSFTYESSFVFLSLIIELINLLLFAEIDPYECYDGAVYVFYENALGRASFTGVNTLVRGKIALPSRSLIVQPLCQAPPTS